MIQFEIFIFSEIKIFFLNLIIRVGCLFIYNNFNIQTFIEYILYTENNNIYRKTYI